MERRVGLLFVSYDTVTIVLFLPSDSKIYMEFNIDTSCRKALPTCICISVVEFIRLKLKL